MKIQPVQEDFYCLFYCVWIRTITLAANIDE